MQLFSLNCPVKVLRYWVEAVAPRWPVHRPVPWFAMTSPGHCFSLVRSRTLCDQYFMDKSMGLWMHLCAALHQIIYHDIVSPRNRALIIYHDNVTLAKGFTTQGWKIAVNSYKNFVQNDIQKASQKNYWKFVNDLDSDNSWKSAKTCVKNFWESVLHQPKTVCQKLMKMAKNFSCWFCLLLMQLST